MFSGRIATQVARSTTSRVPMASRSYATAAASSTKPPVALFGVDGTYASALYTAAAKSSALDTTAKAMENLAGVFKKDAKLEQVLRAPTLSAEDKQQIVAELLKSVGSNDKSDVVKNFLNTLAENNRLGVLDGVASKFGTLMSAARGEVELTVTSATPLDNKVLQKLESATSKSSYVGQGRKLKVVPKVDPEIRGGLIVEIGDRTIDLSVSSKMSKMNKLLRETL